MEEIIVDVVGIVTSCVVVVLLAVCGHLVGYWGGKYFFHLIDRRRDQ